MGTLGGENEWIPKRKWEPDKKTKIKILQLRAIRDGS